MPNSDFWTQLSSIAAAVTAVTVVFAFWQLLPTKRVAQLQFEDALAKEYRDLAAQIPTRVFFNEALTDKEFEGLRDEFFRYIDLSNEQVDLRKRGRVSQAVWRNWRDGIRSNLKLQAFERAWTEVKERTNSFEELRRLENSRFATDPKHWR